MHVNGGVQVHGGVTTPITTPNTGTDTKVETPTPAISGEDVVDLRNVKTPSNACPGSAPRDKTSRVDRMAHLVEEVTPTHFRSPAKERVGVEKKQQRISCTSATGPYFMTLVRTLETHGELHEKTAQAYENLGYTFKLFGNIEKAFKSHRRALVIRRKLFGQKHALTALSMSHVAECLRLDGAETASAQYEDLSVQTMGHALAATPESRSQFSKREKVSIDASYHHDIGMQLMEARNFANAMPRLQRALRVRLQLHGKWHVEVADTSYLLGFLHTVCEEFYDANAGRVLLKSCLKIRERILGDQHPSYAEALFALGNLEFRERQFSKARKYFENCLQVRLVLLGAHIHTANTYNNLGLCLLHRHEISGAAKALTRAVEIKRLVLPPGDKSTLDSEENLRITNSKIWMCSIM